MLRAPVINQWFTTLLLTTVIFDTSHMPIFVCHTFLTFLSNWSPDRIHPINGLDSSCKPHVTRAYQSVVWNMSEWKHVSHVSSSTGMFQITVWTFLRAGKLYITDRRGPSMNVSYFHYRSGLIVTCTHTHMHTGLHRHTSNPRYRPAYKS